MMKKNYALETCNITIYISSTIYNFFWTENYQLNSWNENDGRT